MRANVRKVFIPPFYMVCKVPQLKADQQTGQYLVFPVVTSTNTDFRV